MEPVSAAGLALGILPLIVSTLENYEHTFQPLIIFTRGCRKEVEKFQLALKVQETAFKNACQLLLCSVTEHQREVPVMLNNPRHHYLWHEDRFQRQLSSQLGDSFEACVAAISQVKQTLDFVVRKYGGIGMLMTRSKTESEGHFSSRLKRLRLRSKVSFTQSTLENTIQRLREGNGDLERLSRQIENLKRGIRPSGSMRLASISRFSMVQRASRKLYELLSNQWGCPAEHLANISLGAGVPDTGKDGIRFYLRWECLQCTEPATSNKPVWLAAETFPNSAVTTPHTTPQGQSHGPSKSAQDLVEAIGGLLKRDNAMLTPTPFLAASRIDLKSTPNLCARFKSQSLEPTDGASLGFLQDADASEHMIFPCREPLECQASMSLRDALCQASKLLCGIPPVNRMHLAKVLSEAILQYHSTPWMDSEWRSTDVLFYGIQDLNKDSLDTPYLRACSMKAGSSPRATMVLSQHDYSVLAPNKLLYSLGIMLIELAFERPLKDMQESQEIIASDSPSVSFHRTALRLADVVGKKVNVKYETVVKRCLRCNFDQDSSQLELDELGWQKAYHRTVVCELERCFEAAAIC